MSRSTQSKANEKSESLLTAERITGPFQSSPHILVLGIVQANLKTVNKIKTLT